MGLFGGGMKEGPGIDKNAKKKKGPFLYIDIVFRKFFKLMQTNFLYTLVSLPYLVFIFVFLAPIVINGLGINVSMEAHGEFDAAVMTGILEVVLRTMITLFIFNFMGAGPVSASYAYITRCYTRGEHAWIASDGWDQFKDNFKQGALLLICDAVVIGLAFNAVGFYNAFSQNSAGSMAAMFELARAITLVVTMVYMVMHIYIYQIMVTYKCSFLELLKYSMVIAIAKLPMTVLLTVITGFVLGVQLYFIEDPIITLLIYSIIGMTFAKYPLEFYAARVIDKNIRAERKKQKRREGRITYLDGDK